MAYLELVAALGCGVVAGVFFAFSTFVMGALVRLPPEQGIAAMQSVNVRVLRSAFMVVFLGLVPLCLALAPRHPAASLLYLLGTFGVTVARNVSLNDRLAAVDPAAPGAAEAWAEYARAWTRWNHMRTLAAIAAAALFTG